MSSIENKNNERAKFAFDEVKKISSRQSEFRSLVRSFPTLVQVNGLTAAVAFLYAKGKEEQKNEHKMLYDILSKKLCATGDKKNLMERILNLGSNELRLDTAEAMALLVWIKRFAEGMFEADA